MSSRARPVSLASFIGAHGAPDVVGQTAFQAAPRFAGCFSFGDFGAVVGVPATAGLADLGERDGVQWGVQLPVAAAGQAVAFPVGASDFDRRGAGVGGKCGRSGESAGTAGVGEQTASGDRTDAACAAGSCRSGR